jgi:hypothetical protein
MSTSLPLRRSAHALLKNLVDYAGLFPPAALAMPQAVDEYAAARAGTHAWMLGRFIVAHSRIDELGERAKEFPLSVVVNATAMPFGDTSRWLNIVDDLLAGIAASRAAGARVEALEVTLPPPRSERETLDAPIAQLGVLLEKHDLRDLSTYAELPHALVPHDHETGAGFWLRLVPDAAAAARRSRVGLKLRCGGSTHKDFPSVDEVAAFVAAASGESLRFKATAGLHHPVRHYVDESGFTMHGFLNLLAAAVFANRVDASTLARIVAEEDSSAFGFEDTAFSWRDLRADIDELRAVRRAGFIGYGSCSFSEPVDDLTALGFLPATAQA